MARDRTTNGLARGVIVVDAAKASGSLDTAKRAQKQKRNVLAVRGGGAGVEELIGAGAFAIDPNAIDFEIIANAILRENADTQPRLL